MLDVARMDAEVKILLNKTLGSYSDDYRGNIRRIITGTLDECVRRGTLPRHTLAGIELAPRIVTAEQYERKPGPGVPARRRGARAGRRPHRQDAPGAARVPAPFPD